MYQRALEKFEFEENPSRKFRFMQLLKKKYKDYRHNLKVDSYDKFDTNEERLLNVPEGIEKNERKIFCDYVGSAEYKEMSDRNKRNRSKQSLTHTTGTRSYAVIRALEVEKHPEHQEPSSLKFFKITHSKKDGSMTSTAAEIVDEVEIVASQSSDSPDDIFKKLMGPERHGRVRGYGLGPTPTTVFGASATRLQLLGMLEATNKNNEKLQSRIEDVIKASEEQRVMFEDERKRNQDELKKMENKFDDFRAFIEERMSRGGDT